MVPIMESNGDETPHIMTQYTWYLSSIPLMAMLMNVMSSMFCYEGVILNAYVLHVAYKSK